MVEMVLISKIMSTLCLIMIKMGKDFIIFIPIINRITSNKRINHKQFNELLNRLITTGSISCAANIINIDKLFTPKNTIPQNYLQRQETIAEINVDNIKGDLNVAEVMLRKAWDITGRAAERDWFAWLHGFQCELLSQNPRKELRICSLASKYKGLANNLFNASFLSCWLELNDKFQHECRRSLMSALQKTKLVNMD